MKGVYIYKRGDKDFFAFAKNYRDYDILDKGTYEVKYNYGATDGVSRFDLWKKYQEGYEPGSMSMCNYKGLAAPAKNENKDVQFLLDVYNGKELNLNIDDYNKVECQKLGSKNFESALEDALKARKKDAIKKGLTEKEQEEFSSEMKAIRDSFKDLKEKAQEKTKDLTLE